MEKGNSNSSDFYTGGDAFYFLIGIKGLAEKGDLKMARYLLDTFNILMQLSNKDSPKIEIKELIDAEEKEKNNCKLTCKM